jgi:phage-related protein
MAQPLSKGNQGNLVYLSVNVKNFLEDLSKSITIQEYARLVKKLEMLKILGTALGEPHASPVKDKLWELKVRVGKKWIRILYYQAGRDEFILLHALEKKTNRLPHREIEVALDRMHVLERLAPKQNISGNAWTYLQSWP